MKITLTFTGKDSGLVANLDDGEKQDSLELTMPEATGDVADQRSPRREAVHKFFTEIGDKIWSKMSPDDYEETPPA